MSDFRLALRQVWKNPGFTAIVVLTLGLGIGATSTVFSLVLGVLLTPPPVGSRQNEIAIRMAVGAQRSDVLRLILKDGLRLSAVGIGIGLVVTMALSAGLKTYLFGIGPNDPLTLVVMVLVLLILTLITAWLPARRAAGIDPLTALRDF